MNTNTLVVQAWRQWCEALHECLNTKRPVTWLHRS